MERPFDLSSVTLWGGGIEPWFSDCARCSYWNPLCLTLPVTEAWQLLPAECQESQHTFSHCGIFLSWGLFPRPKVNTCLPQALRSGNFILSRRPIVERTWTLSQRKCSSGVSSILSPLQGLLAGLGGLNKLPRVVVKNVDSGVNWFQILVLSAVWLISCVTVYNWIAFYASVSTICEMGVAIVPTSQG